MAYLNQFVEFVRLNWPTLVEYTLMLIAYFLVFLYKAKVKSTKINLTNAFEKKTAEVAETRQALICELTEAKTLYNKAVEEIEIMRKEQMRLELALLELAKEDEELEHVEDEFRSEVIENESAGTITADN